MHDTIIMTCWTHKRKILWCPFNFLLIHIISCCTEEIRTSEMHTPRRSFLVCKKSAKIQFELISNLDASLFRQEKLG